MCFKIDCSFTIKVTERKHRIPVRNQCNLFFYPLFYPAILLFFTSLFHILLHDYILLATKLYQLTTSHCVQYFIYFLCLNATIIHQRYLITIQLPCTYLRIPFHDPNNLLLDCINITEL